MATNGTPDTWHDRVDAAFSGSRTEQRPRIRHLGLIPEPFERTWYVGAVLDGYPAQLAGLRRGDGLPGGPPDPQSLEPMTVPYLRQGTQREVQLAPVHESLYDSYRSATLSSQQTFSNGNKLIGYIHLWGLSRTWADLMTWERTVRSLAHCDGLIIDLRDALGELAAEHLAPFVPPPAGTPGSRRYYDREIALLQNPGSRGGAETFLRELGALERVVTVGEPTRNGLAPERLTGYPVQGAPVSDPQFDAAMMVLMAIM